MAYAKWGKTSKSAEADKARHVSFIASPHQIQPNNDSSELNPNHNFIITAPVSSVLKQLGGLSAVLRYRRVCLRIKYRVICRVGNAVDGAAASQQRVLCSALTQASCEEPVLPVAECFGFLLRFKNRPGWVIVALICPFNVKVCVCAHEKEREKERECCVENSWEVAG